MKRRTNFVLRILFTILSVFIITFIFINSSLDASASTVQSSGVLDIIHEVLKKVGITLTLSENFVRKCAHFVEYFTLSVSLFFMYKTYFEKILHIGISTLSTGFVTACIDETIQLFSYGRSAQFSDVLLDFFAVMTAFLVLYIITLIIKKKEKEV